MQLHNADDLDDFKRIEKIRHRKEKEVLDLEKMVGKATDAKQKETLKKLHLDKAKTWFKLDDEEYRRLKANREKFAQQCLENYLLSMKACDRYSNDVLRFVALWMSQSESHSANAAVKKHLSSVPSRKFAPLMNQLSSRILDQKSDFQQLLFDLLYRICCDHPYHSLYQVFATSKSKGAKTDEVATSRYTAAAKLADYIMKNGPSGGLWVAIHNSSIAFVRFANERLSDKKFKSGSKMALRDLSAGSKLEQTIHDAHTKTPPPTMKIELRADRDYSSIPTFSKFEPQFSIAGGVSAPKIVTIVASNGSRHKMLLKGGNDDLRQDSIMEQVFEQVSNLLKDHRATRQRNLGIRTYKVIPLTPNAGIIEFVKDTIPLHDYLLPAHQCYFPKDYKPNRCRKEIADAQTKSLSQRLQAYRTVCANFHPVMRFFFMEHFLDPDEWFQKRLNYSRSTAAISILGHVLGLGDRHGHNILLDEQTGEVVHIDLGVAFEAGRVLPVPEVVPFRLTRDLVDGMGMSGVEGVFRRCCNFTLEALRFDQYSIMTILDVLRYDPLYSWSVSPLRLQRMQEEQENAAAAAASSSGQSHGAGPSTTTSVAGPAGERHVNEPSEADRVLTVVAKKLGKSLSAEATVNELIQQATDEKNLACLYCGCEFTSALVPLATFL
jgi:serine-protein kinase ATM